MILCFVLSYNPFSSRFTEAQLDGFIQHNRNIDQWYHPVPGTFLIKSQLHITKLRRVFEPIFNNEPYMLTAGTAATMDGALPSAVWEWVVGNVGEEQLKLLSQ